MRVVGIDGKKDKQALSDLSLMSTNIVFLLADMLEAALVESIDINRKAGYELRYIDKHYVNTALHNIKLFRGSTKKCEETTQLELARDSEAWLQFMWMFTDRFSDKAEKIKEIYDLVEREPSHLHIDFGEEAKGAFDFLNEALKKYEEQKKWEEIEKAYQEYDGKN